MGISPDQSRASMPAAIQSDGPGGHVHEKKLLSCLALLRRDDLGLPKQTVMIRAADTRELGGADFNHDSPR